MTIPVRLLTQTVDIVTAGTTTVTDDEGNATRAAAGTVNVPARIEREQSLADNAETSDGPVAAVTKWLLIVGPEVTIGMHDQVVSEGVTFEVDGPPVVQRTPAGVHHIEARLRLVSE